MCVLVRRRGPGRRDAALAPLLLIVAAPAAGAQSAPPVVPSSPSPVATPQDGSTIAPESPLAPMPDLGVAWPDANAPVAPLPPLPAVPTADLPGETLPGETLPAAAGAVPVTIAGEVRYRFRVEGIDEVAKPLLRERFAQISTLDQNDGQPANAAQLDRRAREDSALLLGLLRAEGYYDARVSSRIEQGAEPTVVLTAEPGTPYRFAAVTITGLTISAPQEQALRHAFTIQAGDPVDADRIAAAEASLRDELARQPFPFATVTPSAVVVDRAAHTATLELAVTPGGERRFGRILSVGSHPVFGADHIQDIARFVPGQPFDQPALVDLRRALIQTGLVSTVDVRPVEGQAPGTVDVAVTTAAAPPRTIAGELGYGTGEGARAEVSWTHRNLFPPEGALTLRGVLGTQEQLAAVTFRRNNAGVRDRVVTVQASASNVNRDAYQATSFGLSGTIERQTNIFFQKRWTWSLGAELVASDERDVIASTGAPRRRTYFIAALPNQLGYDGSDDLLNPTRGFRLSGRLSPEVSLEGAAFGYARVQLDASAYHTIGPVVLAGRTRIGTIVGAPRDAIAPSRRFYAGGGASVRGYGYQDIGPRDPNNDPIGGRSLAEVAVEARIHLFGAFGLVPFLDAGNIYTGEVPDFSGLRYGTGLGLRYYSSFGPIRVDVGTPINRQPGDARLAVYVSLGQAF